jgi:hypothetical protein
VLRTGKVLYYPGTGFGGVHRERAYLLDPATGATQDVTPPTPSGWTIFCSGTSFLPDGRVLVTGGQIRGGYEEGTPTVFTFDPGLRRWTRHADMRLGRWYPSQVLQPDGRTVILSGSIEDGSRINPDVDVFDPRSGTTTTVAELATGTRPPTGDYYPHLAVLPSGRTLVAGAAPVDSWLFRLSGSTFSTKDVRNPTEKRDFATGVLLPDGDPRGSDQYMVLGGGDYGSTTLATTRTVRRDPVRRRPDERVGALRAASGRTGTLEHRPPARRLDGRDRRRLRRRERRQVRR